MLGCVNPALHQAGVHQTRTIFYNFIIKHSIGRSPAQFRALIEDAGVDAKSYQCDFGVPAYLRYVEREDVERAGCDAGEQIHCFRKECRSAVADAEFEEDSMVRIWRWMNSPLP